MYAYVTKRWFGTLLLHLIALGASFRYIYTGGSSWVRYDKSLALRNTQVLVVFKNVF